jgi:hypothetical protein
LLLVLASCFLLLACHFSFRRFCVNSLNFVISDSRLEADLVSLQEQDQSHVSTPWHARLVCNGHSNLESESTEEQYSRL